jgi:hypothetical protein
VDEAPHHLISHFRPLPPLPRTIRRIHGVSLNGNGNCSPMWFGPMWKAGQSKRHSLIKTGGREGGISSRNGMRAIQDRDCEEGSRGRVARKGRESTLKQVPRRSGASGAVGREGG